VHENIVEASWVALVDALTYGLARTTTTTTTAAA
jgi:2-isopropylmalate synthase